MAGLHAVSSSKPSAKVRAYQDGDHSAFRQINLDWIEPLFGVEQTDRDLLDNPQTRILAPGGRILMAENEAGTTIGTVSLIPLGNGRVELAKMGVSEASRGSGAGRALMTAAIEAAREMGANRLWIESNRQLEAALALYRSVGFQELTADSNHHSPYQRCDIQMELDLSA